MKKLMKAAAGRKGVTMMELVIALVIIALISIAAASLLITTTDAEGKAAQTMAAAEYGESTIECFRYAQDAAEFWQALRLLDWGFQTGGAAVDGDPQTYTLDKGRYQITVTAKWDAAGKGRMEYTAADSEGQEILALTYEK